MAIQRPSERTPARDAPFPRTRELLPSQVRAHVLAQHEFLRGELRQLTNLTQRADSAPRSPALAQLKGAVTEFLARLEQHMQFEEQVLEPVLLELDPARPTLVECMREDHLAQRKQFRDFLAALQGDAPRGLGEQVLELARSLALDMDHEDRVLLNPEVLRDDAINIGQEDG